MKKILTPFVFMLVGMIIFNSCKKQDAVVAGDAISDEVLAQVKAQGFGTSSLQKVEGGYLVEGDIMLTPDFLKSKPTSQYLRIGEVEQYRTSNTVLALPRTISIRVSTALPAVFITAVNGAIARYNALNLLIKFTRVTSGGMIVFNPSPTNATYLASGGFPFDNGNPFNQILVNVNALRYWNINTLTTTMTHEIGHCIGMRHTDYSNRAYSCGGAYSNEGASTIGAKFIPGTIGGPQYGSWMLACIGNGVNRPFTNADKIALNFLY
ncbi:MAG: M57 family metalloprotease [Flavitalea sp.]